MSTGYRVRVPGPPGADLWLHRGGVQHVTTKREFATVFDDSATAVSAAHTLLSRDDANRHVLEAVGAAEAPQSTPPATSPRVRRRRR